MGSGIDMRKISTDIPEIPGPGFLVIDTETTGFESDARVIEIGLVFMDFAGRRQATFSTLVRGDGTCGNHWAQRSHGIRPADLVEAPPFRAIAAPFRRAVRDRIPVAHNSPFDLARINFELEILGRRPLASMACTLGMGKQLGYGSLSLKKAISTLGIDAVNSHQAEEDCIAASLVLRHYIKNDRDDVYRYLKDRGFRLPRAVG
jgi:DNA polymerase III subunit epsilon